MLESRTLEHLAALALRGLSVSRVSEYLGGRLADRLGRTLARCNVDADTGGGAARGVVRLVGRDRQQDQRTSVRQGSRHGPISTVRHDRGAVREHELLGIHRSTVTFDRWGSNASGSRFGPTVMIRLTGSVANACTMAVSRSGWL